MSKKKQTAWQQALSPETAEISAWKTYHENAKVSSSDSPINNEVVRQRMVDIWPSLPYKGYPAFDLLINKEALINTSLHDAILRRATARQIQPTDINLEQLSALLHYSYGETRNETAAGFPRSFRVIPSGGAMYPLEIYFHTNQTPELTTGLYHYNPSQQQVKLLQKGDLTRQLSESLIQASLALDASLIIFITAMFERSTFKYQERGYRFALLEAGHLSQNMNLVANAMNLGIVNIGGYLDQNIDELLHLDGLNHSCVYMMAIGKNKYEAK